MNEPHRQHEDILEKMRQERWPDASEAEWKIIRQELIEEIEAYGF